MQQWYAQISALHCFEASDERHIELLQRRKIVVDVCHNLANLIRQKITLAEMRASGVRVEAAFTRELLPVPSIEVISPALAGDFLCEVFRHVLPNLAAHEVVHRRN